MANTYSQIIIQLIFAVKYKAALVNQSWGMKLGKFIHDLVHEHKHKLLHITVRPDHLHSLVSMRPHQSISELMKAMKGYSSGWINEMEFTSSKFLWQDGYIAISHSMQELDEVMNYLKNQDQYHLHSSFMDEIRELMHKFDIDFDERYILKEPE